MDLRYRGGGTVSSPLVARWPGRIAPAPIILLIMETVLERPAMCTTGAMAVAVSPVISTTLTTMSMGCPLRTPSMVTPKRFELQSPALLLRDLALLAHISFKRAE